MQEQKLAEQYLVYDCIAGSHAYGTSVEGISDMDTRGVFIAPPEYYLGLKTVEQVEDMNDDKDRVVFELHKFVKLAANCNPNIIELLFTDPCNIISIDPVFELLRVNRHLFLSKKAKHTFSGYGVAQLKKLERLADQGLPVKGKFAMHLVRLMTMGVEILSQGKVLVKRPDAQHLLDIRYGDIDIPHLVMWTKEMDALMDDLYKKTHLQNSPDIESINKLIIDMKLKYWREKGLL